MTWERIIAGQKRARAQGLKIGKPSKMNEAVRTSVKLLRDGAMGSVYAALHEPDLRPKRRTVALR